MFQHNSGTPGAISTKLGTHTHTYTLIHTWHLLSAKKLALTSLTSGGRSFGIIRLRTEAKEFFLRNWSWPNFMSDLGIRLETLKKTMRVRSVTVSAYFRLEATQSIQIKR
jgi:hypothetical protein